MIQTPFGDLTYGHDTGLQDWLGAHDSAHRSERKSFANIGIPFAGYPLTGKMGSDWFGRHMTMHYAYQQFLTPDSSETAVQLEQHWDTEEKFNQWHRIHTAIHQAISNGFGTTSVAPSGVASPIGAVIGGVVASHLLLNNGTDSLLLNDGSSYLLL